MVKSNLKSLFRQGGSVTPRVLYIVKQHKLIRNLDEAELSLPWDVVRLDDGSFLTEDDVI